MKYAFVLTSLLAGVGIVPACDYPQAVFVRSYALVQPVQAICAYPVQAINYYPAVQQVVVRQQVVQKVRVQQVKVVERVKIQQVKVQQVKVQQVKVRSSLRH